VRHVDELMSSRSEPNGLKVERLETLAQTLHAMLRLYYPDL